MISLQLFLFGPNFQNIYSEYSIYDPDTASVPDTTQTSPERNRQVSVEVDLVTNPATARMTIYHKDGHEEEVALELEGNGMSRKNSILVDMLSPDGPTIESHDGGREIEPANDDDVPPNSVFSHASPVTSNYLASAPPTPPSLTLPQPPRFDTALPDVRSTPALERQGPDHEILVAISVNGHPEN